MDAHPDPSRSNDPIIVEGMPNAYNATAKDHSHPRLLRPKCSVQKPTLLLQEQIDIIDPQRRKPLIRPLHK